MSRSINRVELLGHLGQDIDVKFTPGGTQVGKFSIATSRRWKDSKSGEWKDATDWHNCILWKCENMAQFLTKGKQIFLAGRLQTRSYEDREGVKRWVTEVVVEELILLGGTDKQSAPLSRGSASAPGSAPSGRPPASPAAHDDLGISEEDVPF